MSNSIEFTESDVEKYINRNGSRCPVCDSSDIESRTGFDVDGVVGSVEVQCNTCQATWEDVYRLVSIRYLDPD